VKADKDNILAFDLFAEGNRLRQSRDLDAAIKKYSGAIEIIPNFFEAKANRANCLNDLGEIDQAIDEYKQLEVVNPNAVPVIMNLADILIKSGGYFEAKFRLERLTKIDGHNFDHHKKLGICCFKLGDFEDSISHFIKYLSKFQDDHETRGYLALSLIRSGNPKEAAEILIGLIEIYPENKAFYLNLGIAFWDLGEIEAAEDMYKKSVSLDRNYIDGLFNLGFSLLSQEKFEGGWRAWIKRQDILAGNNYSVSKKRKEILSAIYEKRTGDEIFLHNNDGVGDQLLSSRVIDFFEKFGFKVTCAVDKRLFDILSVKYPSCTFVDINKIEMNLLKNFKHSYPLVEALEFTQIFHNYNDNQGKGPDQASDIEYDVDGNSNDCPKVIKIGISWRSTAGHIGKEKSCTIDDLKPILEIKNIDFFSLQYDDAEHDIEQIQQKTGAKIQQFVDIDIKNDIRAAIDAITELDGIITVSNVNAHYGGFLGKPTFCLVPLSKGRLWYWGGSGERSHWYKSVTIERQNRQGDWKDPIARIARKLKNGNLFRKINFIEKTGP
jgi:tetratricopeptide (TPR) repeat protein